MSHNGLYFEAPNYYRGDVTGGPPVVFLAGGITGVERWHDHATETLLAAPSPIVVLNPNRADFPIHDPAAGLAQVTWEQHHLHLPYVITLFWFPASDPAVTTQPIAMFELGQAIGEDRTIAVGADPGYPRQADIRMMCELNKPGLVVHDSLQGVLRDTIRLCADSFMAPAVPARGGGQAVSAAPPDTTTTEGTH